MSPGAWLNLLEGGTAQEGTTGSQLLCASIGAPSYLLLPAPGSSCGILGTAVPVWGCLYICAWSCLHMCDHACIVCSCSCMCLAYLYICGHVCVVYPHVSGMSASYGHVCTCLACLLVCGYVCTRAWHCFCGLAAMYPSRLACPWPVWVWPQGRLGPTASLLPG